MNFYTQNILLLSFLALLQKDVIGLSSQFYNKLDETCVLSLVVPKNSISSSCNVNKGLMAKVQAIESRLLQLNRRVNVMDSLRLQPTVLQYNALNTKYQTMQSLLTNTIQNYAVMEDKIHELQDTVKRLEQSESSEKDTDRLLDPIKPLLMAEFQQMKANLIQNLEQELFKKYLSNIEETGETIGISEIQEMELNTENSSAYNIQGRSGNTSLKRGALSNLEYTEDLIIQPQNINDSLSNTNVSQNIPDRLETIEQMNVTDRRNMSGLINGESLSDMNSTYIISEESTPLNLTHRVTTQIIKNDSYGINNVSTVTRKEMRYVFPKELSQYITKIVGNVLNINKPQTSDPNFENILLSRLDELETMVTAVKINQSEFIRDHIHEHMSSDLEIDNQFKEIKSALTVLEREIESPQNVLMQASKLQNELDTIKQRVHNTLQPRIESSIALFQQRLEKQDQKLNMSSNYVNIFKETLQSYRNESRNIRANFREQLTRLQNQLRVINKTQSMAPQLNMRLDEMEETILTVEMSQNFADTKLDRLKDTSAEKDRDIRRKFGEIQQSVHRLTNQLSDISSLNLSIQIVDAKSNSLIGKMTKVENTVKYLYIKQKLESGDWMAYNFSYTSVNNACNGKQYIKPNRIGTGTVGKFVGVILCNQTRYKILLGNTLEDDFLDIGDQRGHGEDHCEFIGGESNSAVVDQDYPFFQPTTAFLREGWGEPARRGIVSHIMSPTVAWYECGIKIP